MCTYVPLQTIEMHQSWMITTPFLSRAWPLHPLKIVYLAVSSPRFLLSRKLVLVSSSCSKKSLVMHTRMSDLWMRQRRSWQIGVCNLLTILLLQQLKAYFNWEDPFNRKKHENKITREWWMDLIDHEDADVLAVGYFLMPAWHTLYLLVHRL